MKPTTILVYLVPFGLAVNAHAYDAGNPPPLRIAASAASQTDLTSSPNPSAPESFFALTAAVSGGGPTPTGTVEFISNLCPDFCVHPVGTFATRSLDSTGRATIILSSHQGVFHFFAKYDGDTNYATSQSGDLTQVVAAGAVPIPMLNTRALVFLGALLTLTALLVLKKSQR